MNLDIIFTADEKKDFLAKNGFDLVEFNHDVWNQWGNHDSQGSWIIHKYICAIKNGETPSLNNKFDTVFREIITSKFKNFILEL